MSQQAASITVCDSERDSKSFGMLPWQEARERDLAVALKSEEESLESRRFKSSPPNGRLGGENLLSVSCIGQQTS